MNQNEKNRKSLWLIIAIAASVMAVIVIDINTPLGLADGVLYVLPVGLSLWLPWRRATPIIASVSVLLVIIGFSGLVLERKDLQDDMRRDMEIVHNEAQRISGIVKGLLTFARKQGTEKGPVNIHSIIQGVLQLRSYEQRVNNIEVDTRIAPDGPRVLGNGPQLQQVFLNIIINAEQAMFEAHKRGRITVTTEEAGDLVRISFADDGPGISPESMQKLFTPFFTTKEVGKGTGLGLSICHGIMTEHGGRIYAESEPGKGATFIVELPVKQTTTAHEVSE